MKVLSTDPAAEHGCPAWCQSTGYGFLGHLREQDPAWGSLIVSYIRKRKDQPAGDRPERRSSRDGSM